MAAPQLDAPSPRFEELDPRARHRLIGRSIGISVSLITLMLSAYYLFPLDGGGSRAIVFRVLLGLVLLVVATVVSLQQVVRSQYPMLRAIEALGLLVGFAVVSFASIYVVMSSSSVNAFSEPLGKTDALYFALTTATTIGYGDISPLTESARVVVMIHMVTNVVVVGIAARAIVSAARRPA